MCFGVIVSRILVLIFFSLVIYGLCIQFTDGVAYLCLNNLSLSFFPVYVRQNDEGIVESHWKGAAEIILGLSTRFVKENGEVQKMTPEKVHH